MASVHPPRGTAVLPLAVADPAALIETIRASVIGDDEAVAGPFGTRRVTYADYTASGRSLTFIEDYIREAVLPLYANTHTESSGTGLQTTRFREEAREIIRAAVGANESHAVIFTGSGSTSAIDKLVHILGLRVPAGPGLGVTVDEEFLAEITHSRQTVVPASEAKPRH